MLPMPNSKAPAPRFTRRLIWKSTAPPRKTLTVFKAVTPALRHWPLFAGTCSAAVAIKPASANSCIVMQLPKNAAPMPHARLKKTSATHGPVWLPPPNVPHVFWNRQMPMKKSSAFILTSSALTAERFLMFLMRRTSFCLALKPCQRTLYRNLRYLPPAGPARTIAGLRRGRASARSQPRELKTHFPIRILGSVPIIRFPEVFDFG